MKKVSVLFLILCMLLTGCNLTPAETTAETPLTTPENDTTTVPAETTVPVPEVIKGQTVKVIGYNLDADMSTYKKRSPGMISIFQSYAPDSIGVQEVRPGWMTELKKKLTGYAYIGVNANGKSPEEKGYNGDGALSTFIFYKADKYDVVDSGTFWLSKTPDVPSIYSTTVDCFRTCNWAIFKDKATGFMYAHFNAHLDWMDVKATDYQISLIRDQLLKVMAMGIPVFATGDYNTDEGTSTYNLMLNASEIGDSKYLTEDSMNIGTYPHYDDYDVTKTKPIDFCFVAKNMMTVTKYRVIDDKPDGKYVSDHFGIYCEAVCNDQTDIYENASSPSFDSSATVTADDVLDVSAEISFPAAKDNIAVKEYIVSVNGEERTVSSQFRYAKQPEKITVTFDALTPQTEYTVTVTAVNLYGLKSSSISGKFTTTASDLASDFDGVADILNLQITENGVSDISAAKLNITATNNAAPEIVKDTATGNYVLKFDGSGKTYKTTDITDYYDRLAKGFTMEIYAEYDDVIEYSNMMSNFHAGGFGFEVEDGKVGFGLRVNGEYVNIAFGISEGKFYHITVTYDGKTLKLYIDGFLATSKKAEGEVTFATDPGAKYLCIGADSDASGNGEYPAEGQLMFARIYSAVASADNVKTLYAAVK